MTTINTTVMSLLDLAKRTDPNGKRTTSIVELLAQSNEMLADMVWRKGTRIRAPDYGPDRAPVGDVALTEPGCDAEQVHHGTNRREDRHPRGLVRG